MDAASTMLDVALVVLALPLATVIVGGLLVAVAKGWWLAVHTLTDWMVRCVDALLARRTARKVRKQTEAAIRELEADESAKSRH